MLWSRAVKVWGVLAELSQQETIRCYGAEEQQLGSEIEEAVNQEIGIQTGNSKVECKIAYPIFLKMQEIQIQGKMYCVVIFLLTYLLEWWQRNWLVTSSI